MVTGLGSATVKDLVEKSGLTIKVENEVGIGSEFKRLLLFYRGQNSGTTPVIAALFVPTSPVNVPEFVQAPEPANASKVKRIPNLSV